MNTKNILTVIGVIFGLQAIGIFVGAESISKEAFAAMNPDATGIQISTMLHQTMGVMCLMVSIILLFARDLEPAAASKVLMGASIGLFVTVGQGFHHMFTTPVAPPIPILLITTALGVLGLVTAIKAKGSA